VFLLAAAWPCAGRAATFEVDPAQSSITLSGTVAALPLREQSPGSLTTKLGGSLNVNLAADQIQIVDGLLDAETSGEWRPGVAGAAGSAPADFGALALSFLGTIYGALRDIAVTAASPAVPLSAGVFDTSSIVFSFPPNSKASLDYSAGLLGTGGQPLGGNAKNQTATTGAISSPGGRTSITITVDATFTFDVFSEDDAILRIVGQLVALEAQAPSVPRITSIEIINAQARVTVENVLETSLLQSTANFAAWSNTSPEVTVLSPTSRAYTLPASAKSAFFRVLR